jgi:cell division septation protein DedD
MPKNEEGEFELILGNRQLLSVFFIVVVLLGVFFTMGYIVGRNAAPLATADATPEKKEPKPLVVDSPATATAKPEAAKEPESQSQAPAETAPQRPEPAKAETATEKPVNKPAPAADKRAERAPEKPVPAADHASGTYLQLAATSQREADIEVDVLRKKGFRAIAAEIPEKPGMFRVLVGPMADSAVNKTKTDLQNAGFPGDKAIRRTL